MYPNSRKSWLKDGIYRYRTVFLEYKRQVLQNYKRCKRFVSVKFRRFQVEDKKRDTLQTKEYVLRLPSESFSCSSL